MNHEQGIRNKDRLVLALGSLLLNPKRMKHIESIQPELAADDITRLLADDDATATAALTRLLHNMTGCDIPQTSDLPESEVEELVPLCVSILRRHWTTPLTALGDGTTPMSLADLFRQLIDGRVNGNEALGIPPANANIPAALTALRDRHIADGLTLTLSDGTTTQAPDGINLAQLLCTTLADTITELKDDNVGWTMSKSLPNLFNLKHLVLNCKEINFTYQGNETPMIYGAEVTELPYIERITRTVPNHSIIIGGDNTRVISMPNLKYAQLLNNTDCGALRGANLEEILMPSIEEIPAEAQYSLCTPSPKLRKVVFGKMKSFPQIRFLRRQITGADDTCPELVHIEFGEGTACNIDLRNWLAGWTTTPTALSERLPEFLSNFKTYIAHRLTDKGSGLTLTLSPAVRDAIQQDPEIVSIITSKGWTISPAPSV